MTDQLTVRRVRECCVQLHSCVQRWKEFNSQSFDVASGLTNTTLTNRYCEDKSSYGVLTDVKGLSPSMVGKLVEERERLFCRLRDITNDMGKVVDKMGRLMSNLRAAAELIVASSVDGEAADVPLFSTLTPWGFASYAEELFTAYSQELSLKQSILGDIMQQSNRDTLTVYLSCWLHQPFLGSSTEDKLEALVIEANLRT